MTATLSTILATPPISRIRRNHGLEHATLHVLVERQHRRRLAGHSGTKGFWIIGEVSTEELESAVHEALQRLRSGETALAVHPNCGTNLATAGILAGGLAALAMLGTPRRLRDQFDRLPLAITLATLGLVAAQPLGTLLQEQVTTSGIPGALEIVAVLPKTLGGLPAHRVLTRG